MNRGLRFLRSACFPLVACVGLAMLAWGVVEWQRFYRDLFLEEESAIVELADAVGTVRYRRAGETRARTVVRPEDQPAPVPWSAPFVGRVEFVESDRAPVGSVYALAGIEPFEQELAARERLLRSLDLRGYVASGDWFVEPTPGKSLADLLPLERALPQAPPPALNPDDLATPFPEGETISSERRAALARAIADASRAEDRSRPRLTSTVVREKTGWSSTSMHYVDGQRRFDATTRPRSIEANAPPIAFVTFRDGATFTALSRRAKGWTCFARCDETLPEAERFRESRPPEEDLDPYSIAADEGRVSAVDAVGEKGERIARYARIDETRIFVETLPMPIDETTSVRLKLVLRTDLDFAIERYRQFVEMTNGYTTVRQAERRFIRRGGETLGIESLESGPWYLERANDDSRSLAPPPGIYRRVSSAFEFDPPGADRLFDLAEYGVDWPRPRPLPVLRGYRILFAAGAALCLFGAIGSLVERGTRRRIVPRFDEDGPRHGAKSRGTRPRFALRFGLATATAAGLLVISVAGWVKRHRDAAEEQVAALSELAQSNASFRVSRREPAFPWMFLSTEANPLGAPLERIEFDDLPPAESLNPILALWPDVEYAATIPRERTTKTTLLAAEAALGRELPPIEDFDPAEGRIPRGLPLPDDERDSTIEAALAAWRSTRDAYPTTYLLREEIWLDDGDGERITLRDGDRFWTMDLFPASAEIECRDGVHRRRFVPTTGGWALAMRQRLGGDETADESRDETKLFAASVIENEPDPLRPLDRRRDAARPTSVRRIARPPFCSPPALADRMPDADAALLRLTPDDFVSAERLPDGGLRFALLWPVAETSEPPAEQAIDGEGASETGTVVSRVLSWTIAVRPDQDYAVERCEIVEETERERAIRYEFSAGGMSAHFFRETSRRQIRTRNEFARVDGRLALAGVAFVSDSNADGREAEITAGTCYFGVDFTPDLSGPIFDRATVASPDPPVPIAPPRIRWYAVTLAVALISLGFLSLRRIVEGWRLRSRRTDGTTGDTDPSAQVEEGGPA